MTYAAEAVVEAVRQSTVSAQVTGRIVELRVDVGDYVEKGQVIARIDQTRSEPGARQQRGAGRAGAGRPATMRAPSWSARAISRARSSSARRRWTRRRPSSGSPRRSSQTAAPAPGRPRRRKGYTTVVAPYSGVVSARHVEVGEMAAPGKPLLTGFDPTDMRVDRHGAAVQGRGRESDGRRRWSRFRRPGKWIRATAITVLPSADPQTHSTRVRLDLPRRRARRVSRRVRARALRDRAGPQAGRARPRRWSVAAR